jgi:hypothetical protein
MLYRVAPCGEFPNDNPSLHGGAIWLCTEPCADASCELPVPDARPEPVVTANEPAATDQLAVYEVAGELEEDVATVEVVEDLEFDDRAFDEPIPGASVEDDVLEVTTEGEHPTPPREIPSLTRSKALLVSSKRSRSRAARTPERWDACKLSLADRGWTVSPSTSPSPKPWWLVPWSSERTGAPCAPPD